MRVTECRHATDSRSKRLADVSDIEITQRDIRGTSIVGSSKKSLHNDQPIYRGIIVTYRSYSVRRRRKRREEEEDEEEEDRLYLFGRREGRPSDSIRYKKGRRTPSARMRKVMSRKITGRRRKGGYIGFVRPTESGRVRSRTDDRNVFWLRYRGARGGKKGGTPRGRVFIGLLCQSYSSTGRKPNWYCRHLFRRDLLSRALAPATAAALVFFLASTQDSFYFFKASSHYSGKYDAI